ncbi:hypothetical protein [Pedobacter miscanthi]|uniref:hypothetical protein n=1 Tax=Pedobacter miscanthi TaxID=2259170 RepID=UPI001314AECC|nr:hypothetical protein [Pedobacter miscanthi]
MDNLIAPSTTPIQYTMANQLNSFPGLFPDFPTPTTASVLVISWTFGSTVNHDRSRNGISIDKQSATSR